MIDQVRPAALSQWFANKTADAAHAVVLDVREPWEVQRASVQADRFTLLAIPMNQIPARLAELEPGQPVACLCHHGHRSQQVAMFLAANGLGPVANIAGGIDAWALERDTAVPRY